MLLLTLLIHGGDTVYVNPVWVERLFADWPFRLRYSSEKVRFLSHAVDVRDEIGNEVGGDVLASQRSTLHYFLAELASK